MKQIIEVGNIKNDPYNEKFIEFKTGEDKYTVNRDSIKGIYQEYLYNDGVEDIYKVDVETDLHLFEITTHNPDELKLYLVSISELSFDYYCKDSQRMIRKLMYKNDKAIQTYEEVLPFSKEEFVEVMKLLTR